MSRIELAPEVGDDFERILEHLHQHEVADVSARIEEILHSISVLEYSPLVGRPAPNRMRELVIGRHAWGYVALYRDIPEIDTVFVLALRGQKEAGCKRP
jgi:plasmid stabilization system protein ParE